MGKTQKYAADGFSFVIMGTDSSYFDLGKFYMGWYTQNNVRGGMIAVEYDTFLDTSYNDPSYSHLGINLNFNPVSNVTYDTFRKGINLADDSVKYTWINYDAVKNTLSVFLSKSISKPVSPLISYNINLCSALRPPTCARCFSTSSAYFGFTSSSNYYTQSVNILSWQFSTQWPVFQFGSSPYNGGYCFF